MLNLAFIYKYIMANSGCGGGIRSKVKDCVFQYFSKFSFSELKVKVLDWTELFRRGEGGGIAEKQRVGGNQIYYWFPSDF